MAGAGATHVSFWRRHRWTALRTLLLVALLHRLHFLAFLAASSPVWLLTAFFLGAVLVNSEPNVPLAAASEEDEGRHLYTGDSQCGSGSSSDSDDPGNESEEEDHLVVDREEAVAWTADDEHSIRSIGSLELERDARLEKLMSRRSTSVVQRNLIDLDVHIPAVLAPRTEEHHHHSDHDAAAATDGPPSSAPSSLLGPHTNNPFGIHNPATLRRHESFTTPLARPSRFKPYFVAEGVRDNGSDNSNSNSNSSSPSSSSRSRASDRQAQQEAAVKVEASPCTWDGKGVAVDVELISDSSDDDMSLQADHATGGSLNNAHHPLDQEEDEEEEDSFEVESITRQVAAGKQLLQTPRVTAVAEPVSLPSEQGQGQGQRQHRHQQQQQQQPHQEDKMAASIVSGSNEWITLASVEEKEKRERELITETREHHILGAVPVIDSTRVGAAGAVVAAAPTPPAAAAAAAGPPPVAAAPPPPRPTAAAAPTPPPAAAAAAGPPPQPVAAPTPPPPAAAAAAGPPPVAPPPQPAASAPPTGKLSSKSKVASKKIDPKKAVFGFFRK